MVIDNQTNLRDLSDTSRIPRVEHHPQVSRGTSTDPKSPTRSKLFILSLNYTPVGVLFGFTETLNSDCSFSPDVLPTLGRLGPSSQT